MRSHRTYLTVLVAMTLLAGLILIGCSEEESECPTCPGGTPSPTMDNIWPNEDGNSWTYDLMGRRWERTEWTLYENPDDVPDAPSLDYVEALLGIPNMGTNVDTMFSIFRLEFDGTCEGDSGATGQCLVETMFNERDDDILTISYEEILFNRLLITRPDLAEAVRNSGGMSRALPESEAAQIIRFPLILHGGVWEKVEEYIGTYGDVDTLLAWKFLESDISTGHEFTFQLLPSITSDIFLHCRVISRGTVETQYGTYKNAVECLYMIDHGLSMMEPPEGTRYYRIFDYGTITYAPGIGPIASYERMLLDATVPDGPGSGDFFLDLIGTGSD